MTETEHRQLRLSASDGKDIHGSAWLPASDPAGVIQILHGLGEHSGRYSRFATAASERGYAVYAHDHRGHGEHPDERGFFAEKNGWDKLVEDAFVVHEHARQEHPGLPVTLLGHSMGSFIAQSFAMVYGGRLAALVLSASTWPSRIGVAAGHVLARLESWRVGQRRQSEMLDRIGFARLNRPFRPARTDFDWLTSDEKEVDRYIEDPLCGGPFTTGLWRDFTAGMFSVASDSALDRIPTALPILLTGGALDSLGGDDGIGKLALHYAQTSHSRLKVRLYPEGRHEMLNETNRDDVTRDWLDWIEASMPRG